MSDWLNYMTEPRDGVGGLSDVGVGKVRESLSKGKMGILGLELEREVKEKV